MRSIIKTKLFLCLAFLGMVLITSCHKEKQSKELAANWETELIINQPLENKEPSKAFKNYWYAGEAEISSFKLEQGRYGEIRDGKAVLIYVTEDFLPREQVKADNQDSNNISVLKLNATKKFLTGLYPYSIMQSTFYPVANNQHALKVSSSMQEWCGHVYAQLNNRKAFEITSHSYFQGEADKDFKLEKTVLENELWTQLRIDPKSLPIGDLLIVPSFEFMRLRHIPIKAYKASTELKEGTYTITYPELNRSLTIQFNNTFPFEILGWEETFKSGFGTSAKELTTKASKLETIKSPYWQKNSKKDEILRETLQLN